MSELFDMAQRVIDPANFNPVIHFAAPNYRGHSRSPSRSPSRRHHFTTHELDPLLSDLSPTSTLEALESTDAVNVGGSAHQSVLRDSITAVSTSERALCIRAALAGKKLKEWQKELAAWPWPTALDGQGNGFEPLPLEERLKKRLQIDHGDHADLLLSNPSKLQTVGEDGEEEYWGSLSKSVVQQYEERIEVIRDDMETLDLEELKDHVRDAHLSSRSSRSSLYGGLENLALVNYNHLDDFTAIVTATIMHALPYISRLDSLLTTWSVRFVVLRKTPGFLRRLGDAQRAMDSAWEVIRKDESDITRNGFSTMRSIVGNQIFELGQRLDSMLDNLEGRRDTVPERWIDCMESIEADFGSWVVESERQVLENEWKAEKRHVNVRHTAQNRSQGETSGQHQSLAPQTSNKIGESNFAEDFGTMPNVADNPTVPQTFSFSSTDVLHDGSFVSDGIPKSGASDSPQSVETGASMKNSDALSLVGHFSGPSQGFLPDPIEKPVVGIAGKSPRSDVFTNALNTEIEGRSPGSKSLVLVSSEGVPTTHQFDKIEEHQLLKMANRDLKSDQAHEPKSPGNHQNIETNQNFLSPSPAEEEVASTVGQTQNTASVLPTHFGHRRELSSPLDRSDEAAPLIPEDPTFLDITAQAPAVISTATQTLWNGKVKQGHRPTPLALKNQQRDVESNVSSDTSCPGSATSAYFSGMSSPEIQDATRAEYVGSPVEVTSPTWTLREPTNSTGTFSRQSSQRTERGSIIASEVTIVRPSLVSPLQGSRTPSFAAEPITNQSVDLSEDSLIQDENDGNETIVKRASITSIEVLSRSEVRSITVKRSGSYSSTSSSLSRLRESSGETEYPLTNTTNVQKSNEDQEAKHTQQSLSASQVSGSQSPALSQARGEQQHVAEIVTPAPRIPLKSRHRFEEVSDLGPGSTPARLGRRRSSPPPRIKDNLRRHAMHSSSPFSSPETQLEERISSILTTIPARIRLTSRHEANAPEISPAGISVGARQSDTRSPAMQLTRAKTSIASPSSPFTTPSKTSRPRPPSEDSDIKLYHLHQPGQDIPTKLFVRLVGEGGERVMVRVGGGWADLGEYLKEYASHHGRTSLSDGRFEIREFPMSQTSSPVTPMGSLPTSRPESPAMRPRSTSNIRKVRLSGGLLDGLDTPSTPSTPEVFVYKQQNFTPGSVDSTSRLARPSSRSSRTEEDTPLGLAGPNGKKTEISSSKQAWVDDMIDKARRASVEKHRAGNGESVDLGKAGGIQRVFLKSRTDH